MNRSSLRILRFNASRSDVVRYDDVSVDGLVREITITTPELMGDARQIYNRRLQRDYGADPKNIKGYHRQLLNLKIVLDHYVGGRRQKRCAEERALVKYTSYEKLLSWISQSVEYILKKTFKKNKKD